MAMSELQHAMQVAAAMPEFQRQEIANLEPLLWRLPISDLIELQRAVSERGTRTLRESLMVVRGESVRVAEWHVVRHNDGRETCEHKRYEVGNYSRARHGEIGDATWLEAWIA